MVYIIWATCVLQWELQNVAKIKIGVKHKKLPIL